MLTPASLERLYGVKADTIRNAIHRGILSASNVGTSDKPQWLISESAYLKWVDTHKPRNKKAQEG